MLNSGKWALLGSNPVQGQDWSDDSGTFTDGR